MRALRLLPLLFVFFVACEPLDEEQLDLGPFESSGLALTSAGLGPEGPSVASTDGARTEVWAIRNQWADTSTPDARAAGMAWGANSGLTWEQKYAAWVQAMEQTVSHSGNRPTYEVMTPYGKTLQTPYLECAEMSITMRVLFASWYGLPFYMQAKDRGTDIYFGHFGFRTKTGRYRNTPEYRVAYPDFSDRAGDAGLLASWPSDAALRRKGIPSATDDHVPFLGADARLGWYLDELLLNKRVGHMLTLLLPYFGSVNIADDANAYHVRADNVRAGDILLKRWQRNGIGHVMVVKSVVPRAAGRLTAELASGSMPRRQAVWESPAASKMLFTNPQTGGEGAAYDGSPFVDLGGGLKRYLAPYRDGGVWRQRVLPAERDHYLQWSDKATRAGRPARFEQLLETPSPETLRDELLAIIADRRAWLMDHPSSCSARTAREQAFAQLYTLMQEHWGMSKAEVDAAYRVREDYIFAELVYERSKTCCWNSTNRGMADVILAFEDERQEDAGACVAPQVFKARDGGYADYAEFAADAGASWNPWSADESCPPADVTEDTEVELQATPWCELQGGDAPEPQGDDPFEANDSRATAYRLEAGQFEGARIEAGDTDWFTFDVPTGAIVRFKIEFDDSQGDLDLKMFRGEDGIDSSTAWSSDVETVDGGYDGLQPLYVKVYGYRDAVAAYTITVEVEGGLDFGPPCSHDDDAQSSALDLPAGAYHGFQLCGTADGVDWFRLGATVGAGPLTVRVVEGAAVSASIIRTNGQVADSGSGGDIALDMPSGVRWLKIEGGPATYSLFVDIDAP